MIPRVLATFFCSCLVLALSSITSAAEPRVEFNRDIRPILSDNCFYCHGFDENHREAGLRLDTFEGATEDLGGYQAIVPSDADDSELMLRILSEDPDTLMPPPESEKQLSDAEKELIARWIRQGAEYQEHWAWQSLTRPEVPAENAETHPIDAFLHASWEQDGASPVSTATPREMLRRLSFDLRGIPPTAEEVAEFETSPTDEHFLAFRDRWMEQLEFAEHQAVRWLDLVRWADTSGFVSDEPIASGAYRAWIIDAIGKNLPFDEFSIAQLAGDLMPDATDDQLVASGYNRIVNTNCEAGAIEVEQLYKLKGEHVRALGTVWLGMTTGCAECHDHKFDPLSAKDYYSLAAFFDDLVEAGVYTPGDRREPLHYVHDTEDLRRADKALSRQIEELSDRINAKPTNGMAEWIGQAQKRLKDSSSRGDFVWVPTKLPAPRVLEGSFDEAVLDGRDARVTTADPSAFRRHHAAEFMSGYVDLGGYKTDKAKDAWFVDVWMDPDDRPDMIGFQVSHGDYGRLGWRTANYETYYWGDDRSGTLDGTHPWSEPKRVKRMGDLPEQSGWVRLKVLLEDQIKPVGGQSFEAVGLAWLQSGGRVGWAGSGLELRNDKIAILELGETAIRKWWQTPHNRQVYQSRFKYVSKAINAKESGRDAVQQEVVVAAFREQTQPELMKRLRSLESRLHVMRARAMPVLVSRQTDSRKTTRLLGRGDYQDTTGPLVSPAVPEFLGSVERESGIATRLDLGRWLFGEGSPLVARVFVNRLWHQFYGRGFSETLEDSGTQGEWPSHLTLMNWLAAEFRESGWDRNHMIRLLTSAKAYRLSSIPSAELADRDPGNRMQARQGRFRLTAEAIRDSALDAAGLLTRTTEVPRHSFFPYQPDPYWKVSDKVMFGSRHMKWATSTEHAQYHRSLYTFWKRQNIHPTMLAFDAPTRQECTAKRNITNTPGQALALLNDPIFVEAAKAFAIRVIDAADTDSDRIAAAYQIALQRDPSAQESKLLGELLVRQREHYTNHPEDAEQLTSVGQSIADGDPVEIAAWTTVTRTLLNLHEFLTRS